jgi:hypothetical protein
LDAAYSRNSDNTGAFTVTVNVVSGPPPAIYPSVPAIADIALAGAPDGRTVGYSDTSPLNSPVLVAVTVVAGQVLQISATGLVDVDGRANPETPPEGDVTRMMSTARDSGISSIRGPAGALIGVFLGPEAADPRAFPPDVDFSGAARDVPTLRPLLQQPFFVGRGRTSGGATRNIVVPAGATRVFLGVLDAAYSRNSDNTGAFTVTVN